MGSGPRNLLSVCRGEIQEVEDVSLCVPRDDMVDIIPGLDRAKRRSGEVVPECLSRSVEPQLVAIDPHRCGLCGCLSFEEEARARCNEVREYWGTRDMEHSRRERRVIGERMGVEE